MSRNLSYIYPCVSLADLMLLMVLFIPGLRHFSMSIGGTNDGTPLVTAGIMLIGISVLLLSLAVVPKVRARLFADLTTKLATTSLLVMILYSVTAVFLLAGLWKGPV